MYIKNIISTTLLFTCCFSTVSAELKSTDLVEEVHSFSAYVKHVESLTYIASDNSLWQANDSKKTTAGQNPDNPEETTQTMDDREIFYGKYDNNSERDGLNWRELETIASDNVNDVLYVVNTVNDPELCNYDINDPTDDIKDKPTLYKLVRSIDSGDFYIDEKKDLPSARKCKDAPIQSSYSGMVVIDESIYFAYKRDIQLYDYDTNTLDTKPVLTLPKSLPKIRDMAYDGTYLWILGYFNKGENLTDHWLTKVDWAKRTVVAQQNLEDFNLTAARALAINGNTLYIGENRSTEKNIHVFNIIGADIPPPQATIISSDQLQIATTTSFHPDTTHPQECNSDGSDSKNGVETCFISFSLNSLDLSGYTEVQLNMVVKNGSRSVAINISSGEFDEDSITYNNPPLLPAKKTVYTGEIRSDTPPFDISYILESNNDDFIIEFDALSNDGMGIDPSSIKIIVQ